MITVILTEKQVDEFSNLTGIKANKILVSKNNKYYYATIVDELLKIRISKDIASKFI